MANIGAYEILLSNATATGGDKWWPGGEGVFQAEGTWNSGTVTLQFKSDRGTWIDVGTDTTKTANGAGGFILHPCYIRATVTGSPSAMYASVTRTGG